MILDTGLTHGGFNGYTRLVAVDSDGEQKGSTFTITLPESVVAEAPPPVVQSNGVPQLEQGSGLRVLVVDDNQDAADSLGELLGALEGGKLGLAL